MKVQTRDVSQYDLSLLKDGDDADKDQIKIPPTFTHSQINHLGVFTIDFSEELNMPKGIEAWNSENEGQHVFDLTFIASLSTRYEVLGED